MDQNDFRRLLASAASTVPARRAPAPAAGAGGDSAPKAKRIWQPKKKTATKTKDDDGRFVPSAEYRDRAAERRTGGHAEVEEEEKLLRKIDYERSKFLGGDLEHTHLVKGLDFALLAKIRAETDNAEDDDVEQALEASSSKAAAGVAQATGSSDSGQQASTGVTPLSTFGAAVYNASITAEKLLRAAANASAPQARSQPHLFTADFISRTLAGEPGYNSDRFAPGRCALEVLLGPSMDLDAVPTTILRSREDVPAPDPVTLLDRLDARLALAVKAAFEGVEAKARARREKALERERDATLAAAAAAAAQAAAAAGKGPRTTAPGPRLPATANLASGNAEDSDSDDDIFGGVGRYEGNAEDGDEGDGDGAAAAAIPAEAGGFLSGASSAPRPAAPAPPRAGAGEDYSAYAAFTPASHAAHTSQPQAQAGGAGTAGAWQAYMAYYTSLGYVWDHATNNWSTTVGAGAAAVSAAAGAGLPAFAAARAPVDASGDDAGMSGADAAGARARAAAVATLSGTSVAAVTSPWSAGKATGSGGGSGASRKDRQHEHEQRQSLSAPAPGPHAPPLPYAGADDAGVTAPYPSYDAQPSPGEVTAPYPGGGNYSVTAPYPTGEDDEGVTAPYPGGDDDVTAPYPVSPPRQQTSAVVAAPGGAPAFKRPAGPFPASSSLAAPAPPSSAAPATTRARPRAVDFSLGGGVSYGEDGGETAVSTSIVPSAPASGVLSRSAVAADIDLDGLLGDVDEGDDGAADDDDAALLARSRASLAPLLGGGGAAPTAAAAAAGSGLKKPVSSGGGGGDRFAGFSGGGAGSLLGGGVGSGARGSLSGGKREPPAPPAPGSRAARRALASAAGAATGASKPGIDAPGGGGGVVASLKLGRFDRLGGDTAPPPAAGGKAGERARHGSGPVAGVKRGSSDIAGAFDRYHNGGDRDSSSGGSWLDRHKGVRGGDSDGEGGDDGDDGDRRAKKRAKADADFQQVMHRVSEKRSGAKGGGGGGDASWDNNVGE